MAGLAPPGSAQVGGAEGGPLWTPRFSSSRGAVQRSRGAAAYPAGCMVIRALGLRLVIVIRHVDYVVSPCSLDGWLRLNRYWNTNSRKAVDDITQVSNHVLFGTRVSYNTRRQQKNISIIPHSDVTHGGPTKSTWQCSDVYLYRANWSSEVSNLV